MVARKGTKRTARRTAVATTPAPLPDRPPLPIIDEGVNYETHVSPNGTWYADTNYNGKLAEYEGMEATVAAARAAMQKEVERLDKKRTMRARAGA